jgi:multidrug efflux pump subunit AcrA (membrane-fusion protein)
MSGLSDKVFRSVSIERLSSPEQLDQLVRVVRPFDWAAAMAIALGLLALLSWSVIGRIATVIPGEGVLVVGNGRAVDAVSTSPGVLENVAVAVGDRVRRDQVIAKIAHPEPAADEPKRTSTILSPINGTVTEIVASVGSVLAIGSTVVRIESPEMALGAVVYVPAERGKIVQPGMDVRLEIAGFRRVEFGTLMGTVASISDSPVTSQDMTSMLNNDVLVSRFARLGASYAVVINLQRNAASPNGYRWSAGNGPSGSLTAGTLINGEITIREEPPINLVVPIVKQLSNEGK